MADSDVQIPPNSTGPLVDTSAVTTGIGSVQRQRVALGDPSQGTWLAPVDPYNGLGVRVLDDGGLGDTLKQVLLELMAIRIGIGEMINKDLDPISGLHLTEDE